MLAIIIERRQQITGFTNIIYFIFNEQMLTNLTNQECDRFIPQRHHSKGCHPDASLEFSQVFSLPESNYSHLIKKKLFFNHNERVIHFNEKEKQQIQFKPKAQNLEINKIQSNVNSPVKILDVPNFKDDFYLNNIDWSDKGPLGIALDNQVFLYTPQNLVQVCRTPFNSYVSGLKMQDYIMAVGLSTGGIQMYDIERCTLVRTLNKHQNRVSAFTFVDGLLVSGSKDKTILVHDLRQKDHIVNQFNDHKGEICTLKLKNKNQRIFASGSADGTAIVWDLKYGKINHFQCHRGAVKALDWCPWKNGLLATGGGNATDKSIKLWNTNNSKLVMNKKIDSQISGLVWNEEYKMLVSSHGFNDNQLMFWSLQTSKNNILSIQNRRSFKGHSGRILNLIQSNDQNYLCTVGADENLKFWCLSKESQTNPFRNVSSKLNKTNEIQFRL